MKRIHITIIIAIIVILSSCKNNTDTLELNDTDGLQLVKEFTNANHTVEVYTKSGNFYTGYNQISVRIKNNADNNYFKNIRIRWMPKMQMPTMTHSCPKSPLSKNEDKDTMYSGFLVYQMTGINGSGWSLKFMYTINGTNYMAEDTIVVLQSNRQKVTTFLGSDNIKYIATIIEPTKPKIAINKFKIGLYKMENMMAFPVVPNYNITLDPRMPSMGNHSSPNNTNLTYISDKKLYQGNLSLTMTGYWVLNLKLLDQNGTVLKGENITPSHTKSSFYLELEF